MAENENGQEKTEDPTPKRLLDAREKGDSPRSQEAATAAVFLGAVLAMIVFGGWITSRALGWMRDQLQTAGQAAGLGPDLVMRAALSFGELLLYVTPLILGCALASFIAPTIMGVGFSSEALVPKFERLSPLAGLKRIFGVQGMSEFAKSLLRVLLLGAIGTVYYLAFEDELLQLARLDLATGTAQGFGLVMGLLVALGFGLSLLGVLDVPFQFWSWKRRQKMTLQELLEEMKETEGRPEVNAHIRGLQMEMANRRMMEAVPNADVLVVNPTHYAVALKYEGGKHRAPVVVAKGVDEMALNIRKVALAHGVAIVEAPPLARVLHAQAELDREIPIKLYQAVAQVLSYVYQLKAWTPKRGVYPTLPDFGGLEREP